MKITVLILLVTTALTFGGCAPTMERLDSLEASAQKLMGFEEEALQSGSMAEPSQPAEARITREAAEEIALNHAELTREQVSRLETEWDLENGRTVYEVEFRYDGWEYRYEIDAVTGEILSFERDR